MPTVLRVKRSTTLLIMLVLIPIGIGTKFYGGPFESWVTRYGGDIALPMFFFFLVLLIRPEAYPLSCALGVFIFCVAVEFSQLLSTPILSAARGNFAGRTLLGSEFDWKDMLFYGIGVFLALYIYRKAR